MSRAMTCRFSDDMMLQLKKMSEYESYGKARSKVLRLCVAFTYHHFKKLPKKGNDYWSSLEGDLNVKFKTNIQYNDLQD